ncbi:hypothetical protein PCS8203_02461 [Streptococcus pneumoniae PCS8203]|nr:hypothetical protein PCS8203_02461 [Streptococcus pneumoniae PCS8203]
MFQHLKQKRATDTGIPKINGTKMVAPNMAKNVLETKENSFFQPKDVGQRLVTNQQLILVSYKPHFWASKKSPLFYSNRPSE